jgi:hypothetical protein
MEGQQLGAGAGRALGENGDAVTRLQGCRRLVHDAQRVTLAGALDEERARAVDQRAHQRPMLHIRLGDEPRLRQHRMHGRDVQPGDMVGHDEMTRAERLAVALQRDAEQAQRLERPPLDELVPLGGRQQLEAALDDPQAVQHMRNQARQAPDRSHSAGAS